MPVYYSTTEEEHAVFHLWSNCSEGQKIDPDDLEIGSGGSRPLRGVLRDASSGSPVTSDHTGPMRRS